MSSLRTVSASGQPGGQKQPSIFKTGLDTENLLHGDEIVDMQIDGDGEATYNLAKEGSCRVTGDVTPADIRCKLTLQWASQV